MSPLDVFQHELMTPFKVRIQNTHVVSKQQTKVSVITHGIGGTELNFSHKNRESLDMLTDLGNTVLQFMLEAPGGALIFFPSYALMQRTYEHWD